MTHEEFLCLTIERAIRYHAWGWYKEADRTLREVAFHLDKPHVRPSKRQLKRLQHKLRNAK